MQTCKENPGIALENRLPESVEEFRSHFLTPEGQVQAKSRHHDKMLNGLLFACA